MSRVKVSSKFQVVIPREIREKLNIRPGQNMLIVARNGMVEIVPDRDISELKGFLAGMSTDDIREEDDRY
jgi:AbrB family looped-hinge helix DNA binding protein